MNRWILAVLLAVAVLPGCAGKKPTVSSFASLTTEATFERAMRQVGNHELRQALATLKRMQFTPEIRQELEPLVRLALADATYYQNTTLAWIDARNLYLDFVTLYGDHRLAPYAQIQAGMCSLRQVNHPTRDQSQTLQAIRDLQVVIQRFPQSTWANAAKKMREDARASLAESEYLIGRFYLKRNALDAAIGRFGLVLDRYPDYGQLDDVIFHLGQAHARGGRDAEARIYLDKYVADYPDGDHSVEAGRLLAIIGGPLRPPAALTTRGQASE